MSFSMGNGFHMSLPRLNVGFPEESNQYARRPLGLPPAPPPLLERSLTLSLIKGAAEEGYSALDQEQSIMFQIPEEIRYLILKICIGSGRISLAVREQRLIQEHQFLRPRGRTSEERTYLSLLLICRRWWGHDSQRICYISLLIPVPFRYVEAVYILYSTNIFLTRQPSSITRMTDILSSHHLSMIKSLEIEWCLPNTKFNGDIMVEKRLSQHLWDWPLIWQTLSSLRSLHKLTVTLFIIRATQEYWKLKEDALLRPTMQIRASQTFELRVPWISRFKIPAPDGSRYRIITHDTFLD